jgi:alkylation response protein AidB-like acyl-CoA dehydrogenase
MNEIVSQARALADGQLFPSADETDSMHVLPQENLDALAQAGLYGVSTLDDPDTVYSVMELLAGACLTTTFVWLQHLGPARLLASDVRWGPRLASGELRSGVAFAHLRRSGPPAIVATPNGDGWTISGTAPWVTGGLVSTSCISLLCALMIPARSCGSYSTRLSRPRWRRTGLIFSP